MKKEKKNSLVLAIIGLLVLLGLDQGTKYLAFAYLKGGNSFSLIPDVFRLEYLENRGAAFGLFQGKKTWFVAITFLIAAIMVYLYVKMPMERKFKWLRGTLVLLMAGALGNLIDRLRLDYVVDFFYFELINFPIFNVADIYVTCGIGLLLVLIIFYYKEEDLEVIFPSGKKKHGNTGI